MSEQEFTKKLEQLRRVALELITDLKLLEYTRTSDGVLVQVDPQTGEPVKDQDGYYFACSQEDNPDTCGDALRLYVPVEPWIEETDA